MSHKTATTVAHTIGIDTGENTLHLIGLDDKGAIVLLEKVEPAAINRHQVGLDWRPNNRKSTPGGP